MKASTQIVVDWLKGVQVKGDNTIKEILSGGKDAIKSKDLLEHGLSQDKEDINLLL